MACLTPQDFDLFVRGGLNPDGREKVTSHLESCLTCRNAFQRMQVGQGAGHAGRVLNSADVTVASEPAAAPRGMPVVSGSVGPADVTIASDAGGQREWVSVGPTAPRLPKIDGYQITGVLGQGGMGIVYKAVQVKLNRLVALKVLPAMVGSANPAAVQRFRREATAAARLHHTNIIPIYDFGESADAYYYAMEYIVGQPLDDVVDKVAGKFESPPTSAQVATAISALDVPIPTRTDSTTGIGVAVPDAPALGTGLRSRQYFRQVARWMCDAADALHYAHSQGIIHRDIKPANLILCNDGRIMVADFGLAKSASDGSVTRTGALVGTLRYMSPEQAMARRVRVDHRTDIYSLGVTMYELLCFQPAYPGHDDKEILGAIMTRDPALPRKFNSEIPAELEIICMKCLEKSPEARYETAKALADDLRRYFSDLPIVARRPSPVTRIIKFTRRHKVPVMAVAAFMIVTASVVFWRRESAARQAEELKRRAAQIDAYNDSAQTLAGVTKQWDRAEAELRKALALDASDVDTLHTMAWLKLEYFAADPQKAGMKSQEETVDVCQRILRLQPNDIRALTYLGIALRRLERYPEATEAFERALEINPDAYDTWSNLGALYVILGDIEKGGDYLRKGAEFAGVAQDRWRAAMWRNLATYSMFRKDPRVLQHVATAISCNSTDLQTWIVRARIGMELDGHLDAQEALDDAKHADRLGGFQSAKAKRILALAHLAAGEPRNAIEHARLAIDLKDEPSINLLILATASGELGLWEDARRYLSEAEAAWPAALREPAAYAATAGTGDLWIDTAEERLRLAQNARERLAAAGP